MCECLYMCPYYCTICLYRICKYLYNSNNYISECIAEIVSADQLSTFNMDTSRNIIGQNWSYISSNQRKVLTNICQRKIYEAFQKIENDKNIKINTEIVIHNMNLSINYIARQISYNLKLHTLYFNFNTKISADETDGKYKKYTISSYEYTKLVSLEEEIIKDEYRKASIPTEDGFKYKNISEFYKGFLTLKHKDTGVSKTYDKITTNESDYNKLNERYFNLLKIVYENNTDYEKIILDSFEKINQNAFINNKNNTNNENYE